MDNVQPENQGWRSRLYSQVPLKSKNGTVRLLTIEPRSRVRSNAAEDQNITQCFLKLGNLKTQQSAFVAISHACEKGGDEEIMVNGALVPVSTDIAELLRSLQHEHDPVTIWMDALCINYSDVEEKSAQLAQMPQILSAASSTLVWLGGTADGSHGAMDALNRLDEEHLTPAAQKLLLAALRKTPWITKLPTTVTQPSQPAKEESLEDQLDALRTSFKALMSRPYWSRLWSLTELVFTNKGTVMCGTRSLDLHRFHAAAKALDGVLNMATYSKWLEANKTTNTSANLDNTEPANFSASPALLLLAEREFFVGSRGWWSSTEHPLLTILMRYHLNRAETRLHLNPDEQCDLIFGFVGLSSDAEKLGISIDYRKDWAQVCAETTTSLLQHNPRVLQLCLGHSKADDGRSSWLVDWSKIALPASYDSGRSFNACGPADVRFYRADAQDAQIITMKGVILDIINSVTSVSNDGENITEDIKKAIDEKFQQSLSMEKSPYTQDQQPNVPTSMLKESCFVTDNGYIGCGEGPTKGDVVAILYGSEVPFALRKQADETYRLIGEVYIEGIMEGEFMKSHRAESIIKIC
ncbi:hypothetical protein PFICI_11564 [Pestalotiopsis fici W106-1]|uniref:Heterokaryon incompatibility domain-containing protein n=1 Tax=Pestalotiopsis fici (strain W106-1 / CGMCC3.15140) TaxID=1229662 RepID=W3WSP6_PESFW|nr:uncharacterized protein PFICI_11564 [Pestalotiopsis fici W106-1]ETS76177.1 hypothetical protein PFICI_11564 [Pestalotiopsis fici W106-1]